MDKGAIGDGFEAVASPAAANEAVKPIKTEQEDDGIVIATPSESWVLLDSKSDDEEVTLDAAATMNTCGCRLRSATQLWPVSSATIRAAPIDF